MKSMLKDAGILFAITLVAGLLLGLSDNKRANRTSRGAGTGKCVP